MISRWAGGGVLARASALYAQYQAGTLETWYDPANATHAGQLLEDFTSTSEFSTASGTNGGVVANAAISTRFAGTQIKLQSDAHSPAEQCNLYKTTGISWDLSTWPALIVSAYVPALPLAGTAGPNVYVSSDAFTNFSVGGKNLFQQGWNDLVFKRTEFTDTGTPNMAAIIGARFRELGSTTLSRLYYLGGVAVNRVSRPRVLLTFDDGWDTQYSIAWPYMQSTSLPGTFYIIPSTLGTSQFMTTGNLDTLYAAGAAISGHEANELDALDLATLTTTLTAVKQYLDGRGYTRSSAHFCWPGGKYGQNVGTQSAFNKCFAGVNAAGFSTAVGGSNPLQATALGIGNRYAVNRNILDNTLSLATAKARIDDAISTGTTVIFGGHKFGAAADSLTWVTSDFQSLCDYIKTKVDANAIDALTIDQWWTAVS